MFFSVFFLQLIVIILSDSMSIQLLNYFSNSIVIVFIFQCEISLTQNSMKKKFSVERSSCFQVLFSMLFNLKKWNKSINSIENCLRLKGKREWKKNKKKLCIIFGSDVGKMQNKNIKLKIGVIKNRFWEFYTMMIPYIKFHI